MFCIPSHTSNSARSSPIAPPRACTDQAEVGKAINGPDILSFTRLRGGADDSPCPSPQRAPDGGEDELRAQRRAGALYLIQNRHDGGSSPAPVISPNSRVIAAAEHSPPLVKTEAYDQLFDESQFAQHCSIKPGFADMFTGGYPEYCSWWADGRPLPPPALGQQSSSEVVTMHQRSSGLTTSLAHANAGSASAATVFTNAPQAPTVSAARATHDLAETSGDSEAQPHKMQRVTERLADWSRYERATVPKPHPACDSDAQPPDQPQPQEPRQPQQKSVRTSVLRYSPMQATPDAASLRPLSCDSLVRMALGQYAVGRHPTPNLYTAKGNPRAMNTANGVMARAENFVQRETDPNRVGAQKHATARAQDIITIAVSSHGTRATVDKLVSVLMERGHPMDDDGDSDSQVPAGSRSHHARKRTRTRTCTHAGARDHRHRSPHARTPHCQRTPQPASSQPTQWTDSTVNTPPERPRHREQVRTRYQPASYPTA